MYGKPVWVQKEEERSAISEERQRYAEAQAKQELVVVIRMVGPRIDDAKLSLTMGEFITRSARNAGVFTILGCRADYLADLANPVPKIRVQQL